MMPRRTHIYLGAQSDRLLADLATRSGKSRSEVMRNALRFYGWALEVRQQGGKVLSERDGRYRELLAP